MEFDVNINNKQKHWVLVIIDKCKNVLLAIFGFIWKCIKAIGRFLKKAWKWILGIIVLIGLIIGGISAYDYYTNTYIPQKKLDAAVEEITASINSKNDSIKIEYALYVLDINHEWGFDDVSDLDISSRLAEYREDSFKLIESKAYSGEAKWQYILGQMYYWGDQKYSYVQPNYEKAAYWWSEAASQDYTKAYNNLGCAYKDGIGVEKDIQKAIEYLKKGAEAGEAYAQKNYGDLFMEGVKIQVGSHKRLKPGYNPAIYNQYDLYAWEDVPEYKTLIPKDIEQAKAWWKKSAAQDNEGAKERLQKIY